MNNIHFSSKTPEWSTPQDLFDDLNKEFSFTLDVAATPSNAKTDRFFTEEDDGLKKSWDNENIWCNPPYGRQIGKWVEKGRKTVGGGSSDVVTSPYRYKVVSQFYSVPGGD